MHGLHMLPVRLALASLLASGLASGLVTACAGGAPPGFSSGDTWVFPLVGPLENGVLITPVTFGDQGPFLFA